MSKPIVSGRTSPEAQGLAGASRSSQGGLDGTVSPGRPETTEPKWPDDFRGFGTNVKPKKQK